MKTRILLFASLLLGAMTVQAQTVTYNGVTRNLSNIAVDDSGPLWKVASITLGGTWTVDDLELLGVITSAEYLQTVDMSDVTFSGDIRFYVFNGKDNLTTVTMPSREVTVSVDFGSAFYGCAKLTSVDLSRFKNITNFEYALGNCSELTTVTMPATEVAASINLHGAFLACSKLINVDLSAFKNINNMNHIFSSCSELTAVTMPVAQITAPVDFTEAFSYCSKLTKIDLSAFKNITNLEMAFDNCSELTSVTMLTEEITNDVSFSQAFNNCQNLTSIDLSAFKNITDLGGTFRYCPQLTSLTFPSDLSSVEMWMNLFGDSETEDPNPNLVIYIDAPESECNLGTMPQEYRKYIKYRTPDNISTIGSEDAIPALSHVYTTDGRLVKTVPAAEYGKLTDGLDRGIYMVNGKKIAVE